MPVIRKDTEHDELKSMLQTMRQENAASSQELKAKLEAIEKKQIESEKREEGRKYLDNLVLIHETDMNDNGKPGLRSVRTKVLNFETRLTGIGLLVAGDIILRVVQFFLEKS